MNNDSLPPTKYEVLIVGAGVAGLSAGLTLHRNQRSFAIIEKTNYVGGLSTTWSIKEGDMEFRSDNGPHVFAYGKGAVGKFIESVIPKENMIPIKLKERIFIDDKVMDYPVIPKQMIKAFGMPFIIRSMLDYFGAVLHYGITKKQNNTFYEFVVANMGKTLAYSTTISYLEKIFGIPAKELHSDLAKQRFNFLSLSKFIKEIVKNLIIYRSIGTRTKKSQVYAIYPQSGIGLYSELIKRELATSGRPIFFNSYLTKINHVNNHFTKASVLLNGKIQNIEFDHIIESIPIEDFINLMDPSPPDDILSASKNLPYRNQVYLFITLDMDRFSEYTSFYFSGKDVPFCRVTEMKNFDKEMAPREKTSLLLEFFCDKGDKISNLSKDELFELSVPFLEDKLHLDRKKIRNYYYFPLDKAYPIYTLNYRKNLDIIMQYLDSFDNLSFIGRTGKFEYISQPRAIDMGLTAADKIIKNKNIKSTPLT